MLDLGDLAGDVGQHLLVGAVLNRLHGLSGDGEIADIAGVVRRPQPGIEHRLPAPHEPFEKTSQVEALVLIGSAARPAGCGLVLSGDGAAAVAHTAPKTRATLWPPNPNELVIARRTRTWRASLGT